MVKEEKPKCNICGKKESKDPEISYRTGYYKLDLQIARRKTTYQICSKCNRCFIVEENGLTFENGSSLHRKVYIRGRDD